MFCGKFILQEIFFLCFFFSCHYTKNVEASSLTPTFIIEPFLFGKRIARHSDKGVLPLKNIFENFQNRHSPCPCPKRTENTNKKRPGRGPGRSAEFFQDMFDIGGGDVDARRAFQRLEIGVGIDFAEEIPLFAEQEIDAAIIER